MAWISKRLRGAKVWVRCDGTGEPLAGPDQRVDVLYQKGGKVYRAAVRNLGPDDDPLILSDEQAAPGAPAESLPAGGAGGGGAGGGGAAQRRAAPGQIRDGALHDKGATPGDAIHVYTDGACTGNPGPMGIGVVILDGTGQRRELSEYLGVGTNNIAELTAILRGLADVARERTVVVYSDSSYALGLLGKGWKAKANQELVEKLRRLLREFRDVRLVKVAGHAGVAENERCDELARQAVARRR